MSGRDPMKGRHSVGVQRVNTGKQKGGQSEPASNKVKTFGSYSITPKTPVLNDAKETSLDLQKRISGRAQQPFTNKGGAATLPTPASPRGSKPGLEPKGIYANRQHSNPGAKALPNAGAVGYKGGTAPIGGNNQVISGRFGKSMARKAGVNGSGYPSKRNASFYGDN